MSFFHKLAFVTGGGSGIGRATAKILAREGASVVVADKNTDNILDTLKSIPKHADQEHLGVEIEVSELNSVKDCLKKVLDKYRQPPTIIVNSAGITRDNFLLKLSEQDFDEVLDVNLKVRYSLVSSKYVAASATFGEHCAETSTQAI
ncbi:unnamed protein product [Acanthoscelides obtectus]|uniref:Uncharacterized protein n=1 Tax=Acanthoscelides obtectus TaxID=200917 RepID=A0A9P0L2X3_ACAOB|nr:unnamed protein product [Acanthoscelides obtectus]CAK1674939.1 Estradiol 17-beta-dehydrogenase 8 [Acanthoscelides obtectus]